MTYLVCVRTYLYVVRQGKKLTIIMSVDILTGRPKEEVSGSSSDLLQELSQMHERARQAMQSIAKALWPSDSPPGSMEGLVQLFKRARRRFRLWKIRYTKLDPNHMGRVGPLGSDGKEIPVSLVYDQV